jgi:hypothetical protein
MALNKAIQSGKEHRKPWHDSRAIDGSCENHGSCPWCRENRLYQRRKLEDIQRQDLIDSGFTPEEVEYGMQPLISFHAGLDEYDAAIEDDARSLGMS